MWWSNRAGAAAITASWIDVATWLRFDRPPRLADGAIDPLGVLTLADRMPGSIAERLGHQGPRWFAPSADLTVHLLGPLRTEWLLAHDHARWAGDGWASADSKLWDQNGTLVAYATQMMLFTYAPDQPKLRDSQDAKGRCDDRLPHPLGPPA